MRLIRFDDNGTPRLGVMNGAVAVSLASLSSRFPSMLSLIAGGKDALAAVQAVLDSSDQTTVEKPVLLAPIERPGKYLAIGMNYRKHIEEVGASIPPKQFWFNKQTTCISGPFDDIDPGVSEKVDYEVELGVIIGHVAKHVSVDNAKNYVFGYVVCNDVSARDWQGHSPTFTMGKSFDTHGPVGPWIVTADEISDPHSLGIRCYVNGDVRQDSNTSELVYNVWEQISYLSDAFTLEPGDLLATGTPSGVGLAMKPQQFLQVGDVVRCEVDQIGTIENRVVSPTLARP
ncbi:5-carboxymethyl-2-hydroxymuconate isomerase [Sphingomonas sp. Root710]|uniref:fumarylacetoacetate hydrolase family protein n=1 Tax=Sphingomonas sp. Root710 TaxID=1736594 RepID=UPI0006F9CE52|nr:fumarylacetoacetate hydrolase family protein [Sphingomonas sp. Root710]KRB86734.1 5-carboxymethyl-2-hydroxymuconate isomerase [Sphingomonas sp. Root710]